MGTIGEDHRMVISNIENLKDEVHSSLGQGRIDYYFSCFICFIWKPAQDFGQKTKAARPTHIRGDVAQEVDVWMVNWYGSQ